MSVLIVSSVGNTARWNSWSQIVKAKPRFTSWGPSTLWWMRWLVRADEDPFERPEAQPGVRVSEGDHRSVGHEQRDRQHAVGEEHHPGINATRYDTWIRGWVRKTVSTLMSSCEWCSSWKRQSIRARWFARCTIQLHASMVTKMTPIAAQRGTTPICGRTIHGADVRATCTNASVSAVTSGATTTTFTTVKMRSWRYPRASLGRTCAGHVRSTRGTRR